MRGESFNREVEVTFGAGALETPLTGENEAAIRELAKLLFFRRTVSGDKRDALYRMQPERWLESVAAAGLEAGGCASGSGACVYAGAGVCGGRPGDAGPAGCESMTGGWR